MAVASIKSTRNTDPATSLVNVSREDLATGDVITLESVGAGTTSHSWSILFSPEGSASALTSTNTAVTQFQIDKEGAYLVRLVADAGLETETMQHIRMRVLTAFGGLQLVAAGERRDEEAIIPVDIGVYGWAYEQNGNIRKILDFIKPMVQSGRVLHVDGGSENYGDFHEIQDGINAAAALATEAEPYVVLVREGTYQESLSLKPFVHVISTQHQNSHEIPDLKAKPKMSPRVVVDAISHDADLPATTDLCVVVGIHFLCDTLNSDPLITKTGEGVIQANACTFESTPVGAGQGSLVDLKGGRFVGLDCRFRLTETGDVGNFAFLQSGEDTTSLLDSCSITAPSGFSINPNQHNVAGVINVLRNCTVKTAEYGLATNGTSTVINSSLVGGVQNLSINWLGSSYGVSNSGNSEQTILFSEIEGDIYWNKDNTSHNNELKIGSVVFETLNESGTGSAITVKALANSLSMRFDTTNSSLTSESVQEAIVELEGLINSGVGTAVNLGGGEGLFKQKTGVNLEFRSLSGVAGISIAPSGSGDELEIGYSGAGISNQINQLDSSVIVSDTGTTAAIEFYINGSLSWRVDSLGDLVSATNSIGNSTDYLSNLYSTKQTYDVSQTGIVGHGEITWDSNKESLVIGGAGGITHYVGQQTQFYARNEIPLNLPATKGQIVQLTQLNGNELEFTSGLVNNTPNDALGVLADDVANGDFGYVVTHGLVSINTSNLTGSVGERIYQVGAGMTMTRPTGVAVVVIGTLVKKAVNGEIFVNIQNENIVGWHTDSSNTLVPNGSYDIGTAASPVSYIFAENIGTLTDPVDQIYVTSTNSLHFVNPNTNEEYHVRVDTNGIAPRLKVGDMLLSGVPDSDMNGVIPADHYPLLWDMSGEGNHILGKSGMANTVPPVIKIGDYRIPVLELSSISIPDAVNPDPNAIAIEVSNQTPQILNSDDAHDLIMHDPTNDVFVSVPRASLDLPYANITGTPTSLSDFTNDMGFLTSVGLVDYNDLLNKPSNLSEFINDSFFGDEIHFEVAPSANGQTLIYDLNSNQWKPTAQMDLEVNWNKVQNKPTIFSGDYNDLSNKPTFFNGDYNALSNKPTLFSGNYNDLNNIPTPFSGSWDALTNKPTIFDGDYNNLINKPSIPTQVNQLSFPNGLDGDVLTRDGNNVEYTSQEGIHIDPINRDEVMGDPSKSVSAEFGKLHLINLSKGDYTLELPPANTHERFRTLVIKLIGRASNAYNLTIKPTNGDMIDTSGASLVWTNESTPLMKTVTLYSDGSDWWII